MLITVELLADENDSFFFSPMFILTQIFPINDTSEWNRQTH